MLNNIVTKRLNIEYPIIQAPMAGGITSSSLVAAVSNSGGLGMIGAGYMTPDQIRAQIKEIKQLTSMPFGINLFVPNEFQATDNEIEAAQQQLNVVRELLGIQEKEHLEIPKATDFFENFVAQIQVAIEEKLPVCSFTFGIPSKQVITELKQSGMILIGTATTVREAVENERAGMDFVVVQGSEAGGHRGSFQSGNQKSAIGLMSLIPQAVDHIGIPVIAAGGIMDGRGLVASLCLGAKGVQMGTAFLTCSESGAHPVYKQAILNASDDETVLTRSFSGKWARGKKNKFIEEMQKGELSLPEYPVQNTLTQDIRKASASQNNPDFMSLWSGQSSRLAKNQKVDELINNIVVQAKTLLKGGE